ncbi:hypothetical protein [Actinoplanes sp. RD1]|uniref:hypothetical protein n=1 Tax=Actinoplanes sp. RD1 TaxID=3064538 RepID=UPI002741E536|nr:hypothetical protein [Actinoplanes sp. RD1]
MGTVSGLALLAGGTAVAAVAGGAHSVFATVLLGMLTVGMSHALLTEIRRQARRRNVDGWARQDTVNTALLASWSSGALIATLLAVAPASVRAVGLMLALGYAVSCAYFVVERCRTIADGTPATTSSGAYGTPATTSSGAYGTPGSTDLAHPQAPAAHVTTEVKPAPPAAQEGAPATQGKAPAPAVRETELAVAARETAPAPAAQETAG